MVGSEEGLFVRSVSYHEVHDGAGRLKMVGRKTFFFQLKIRCMYKSDHCSECKSLKYDFVIEITKVKSSRKKKKTE